MTEAEWLAGTDAGLMTEVLHARRSGRKCWLFTAASCARAGHFLPPEILRQFADLSERLADAEAPPEVRVAVRDAIRGWKEQLIMWQDFVRAAFVRDFEDNLQAPGKRGYTAARWVIALTSLPPWLGWDDLEERGPQLQPPPAAEAGEYRRRLADLLRDLLGNPFRPVSSSPDWLLSNGGAAVQLAQAIYAERAFDRLPILADALEDAGCDNADILAHCRQPGEHVRGCWVVDLLLAKE